MRKSAPPHTTGELQMYHPTPFRNTDTSTHMYTHSTTSTNLTRSCQRLLPLPCPHSLPAQTWAWQCEASAATKAALTSHLDAQDAGSGAPVCVGVSKVAAGVCNQCSESEVIMIRVRWSCVCEHVWKQLQQWASRGVAAGRHQPPCEKPLNCL